MMHSSAESGAMELERAAAAVESLLREVAAAAGRAVDAVERGDLDVLSGVLDERARLLAASEPHFRTLRAAADEGHNRPLLERVVRGSAEVAEADSRLQIALGANLQQLGTQIRHAGRASHQVRGYAPRDPQADGTIDVTR